MSSLKITRLVGHGSRPAQTFTQSPVKIGTMAGCTLKFDSGWDKGVAERHAIVELTPRGWVWRDLAGTTLCNGVLMHEAKLIDGTVEFELSPGGVRLKLEGEAVRNAPPASAPQARNQGQPPQTMQPPQQQRVPAAQVPVRPRAPASGSQTKTVVIIAAVFVALLLAAGVAGIVGWKMMSGGKKPKVVPSHGQQAPLVASNDQPPPPPVPTPDPVPVPVPQPPPPPAPSPAPAPAPTPTPSPSPAPAPALPALTAEQQEIARELKKSPIHAALVEYWRANPSRSPYAKAALRFEDHWLVQQLPWMVNWKKSGGRDTGKGALDYPGIFIPEAIYAGVEEMGVPMMPGSMATVVMPAVAENTPSGQPGTLVASRSGTQSAVTPTFVTRPEKSGLLRRLTDYATPANTQSTNGGGSRAWAVLVGINRFEGAPPPPEYSSNLSGCRNDVAAIGKVLMTQGIFEPERVRLMTDARKGSADYPSKANVVAALADVVAKAGPQDVVFVAFSTHGGYSDKYKDSALIMADKPLFGIEMLKIFEKLQAKNLVISMDACHTGGMEAIGSTQQTQALKINADGMAKDSPIPEAFYEQLGTSRGHVVIRACRFDQTTPDIRTYGHGILTATMVSGLTGDADRDNDGIVTLSELRVYVTTAIPQITKRAIELGYPPEGGPLQPTFTSSAFGEAGDLPLTVVPKAGS